VLPTGFNLLSSSRLILLLSLVFIIAIEVVEVINIAIEIALEVTELVELAIEVVEAVEIAI
jgi:hypothetical protein